MIRPFTFVCVVLAAGSGLYLYQAKHRAHVLDRDIEDVVHATEQARARSGVLQAEWQLLNDTERLGGLADRFLTLKATTPGQFATLADLAQRLPAIRPPEPRTSTDADEESGPALVDDPPVPPIPPERPPEVVAAPHPGLPIKPDHPPAEHRSPPPTPVLETRVVTQPAVLAVASMSPVAPRPPAPLPSASVPTAPFGGSLGYSPGSAAVGSSLGMARTALPMPVPIGGGPGGGLRRANPADSPGG